MSAPYASTVMTSNDGSGTGSDRRPLLLASLGAACISASAILVKLADTGTATTAFFRCFLALPVLVALAAAEQRRHGPRRAGARGAALLAGGCPAAGPGVWSHPTPRGRRRRRARPAGARRGLRRPAVSYSVAVLLVAAAAVADQPDDRVAADHLVAAQAARGHFLADAAAPAGRCDAAGRGRAGRAAQPCPGRRSRRSLRRRALGEHSHADAARPPAVAPSGLGGYCW